MNLLARQRQDFAFAMWQMSFPRSRKTDREFASNRDNSREIRFFGEWMAF
jgi:hypothetical protein